MTVSKTPVNKHDIVSNIPLSVEVYQVILASVNFRKFIRPNHQKTKNVDPSRPNPIRGSTRPMDNSGTVTG